MQINFINSAELADLLSEAKILSMLDNVSQRVYVLEYTGADILVITEPAEGSATVIYGSNQFDDESGGSIHDHARHPQLEEEAAA